MRLDAAAGSDASDEHRRDAPIHDATHDPAQDDGPRENGAAPYEPAPPGALARAVASIRAHASLADALRLVGAALLVTSLSRFLLAGVEVDDDLHRFALLLGQTALFTGAGFVVARLFDDARGARLLFALALLSVPAGFAVLGAMAYSFAPLDPAALRAPSFWPTEGAGTPDARDLPAFARWRVASLRETLIATGAAAAVLLPTTFFALAVLARGAALRIGVASLLACAFLLVPVRDPSWTGLLVLGSGLVAALALRGPSTDDPALHTLEARFARLLPFAPALVIAARTFVVDSPDAAFLALSGAALVLLARASLRAPGRGSRAVAVPFTVGVVGAALVGTGLHQLLPATFGAGAGLIAFAAAGAAVLELGRRVAPGRSTRLAETCWSLGLLGYLVFTALVGGAGANAPGIVAGASTVVALSLWRARPWLGVAASPVLAIGLAGVALATFEWMTEHGWQSLVALGLAAVIGGSVVQRHGPALAARWRSARPYAAGASKAG